MPLSGFSHLTSLTVNSGTIPDALTPASECTFSFAYEVRIPLDYRDGSSDSKQTKSFAKFEVRDASGTLLLAWDFSISIFLAYILLAPGIAAIYTWYMSNITTHVTFPDALVGKYGSGDGYTDNGGSDGSAIDVAIIDLAYFSPLFQFDIPVGSTVKIVSHNAGFGNLSDIAQLSIRTRPASAGFLSGYRHSIDGEGTFLYLGKDGLHQVRTRGRSRAITENVLVHDTSGPIKVDGSYHLLKPKGSSRQTIFYDSGGSVHSLVSYDDGITYQ